MSFAARRAIAIDATASTFGISDGIVACMIEAALAIAFSFARIKEPEMSDNLGISIRKGYAIGCKVCWLRMRSFPSGHGPFTV